MPTEPQLKWHDGWIAQARRVDSPNVGPRPAQAHIDLLVLHSISLPPGARWSRARANQASVSSRDLPGSTSTSG